MMAKALPKKKPSRRGPVRCVHVGDDGRRCRNLQGHPPGYHSFAGLPPAPKGTR